jgi:16S rRNA (adenine1518-N6/adenine1519-N6)-dimethyltransferase
MRPSARAPRRHEVTPSAAEEQASRQLQGFVFPPLPVLLSSLGVRPEKARAQHFLTRHESCDRIAELAGITAQHAVLEIGAGLGNLTYALARRAARVTAVEPDTRFRNWHAVLCANVPNIRIVTADFLEAPLEELLADVPADMPVAAAGNLPYHITSPILFRLIEAPRTFDSITAMIQREVAERIVSATGTRDGGGITYKVALRYVARRVMELPPGAFLPPPAVHSAVIRLVPRATPLYRDEAHRARLHRILDAMFQHRRKTLPNALLDGGAVAEKGRAVAALADAHIDPRRRPETLSLDEFLALEEALAR